MVDREDPMGMGAALADFWEKQKAFAATLEGVPFHYDTIPASEVEGLRTVRQIARARIAQYEKELSEAGLAAEDTENRQVQALNAKHFAAMEDALDKAFNWKTKFSTESQGGSDSIAADPEHDSIYYVSRSNASLRLRRQSFHDGLGLRGVVQPIAEKIWFRSPGAQYGIEREPKVGLSIREAITDDFLATVRGESDAPGDYKSAIRIYEKDGQILHVNANEKDIHEGDHINKIYFNRQSE